MDEFWEGPEPTDEQVIASDVEETDGENFHEELIYHLLVGEVSKDDPIYRGSLKRFALQTGLPVNDVQIILMRLISEDLIEPVAPYGYRIKII